MGSFWTPRIQSFVPLHAVAVSIVTILLILLPAPAYAQSSADCLVCHSNRGLAMVKKGRTISLYVHATVLQSSVHGFLSYTDCHAGFNPEEIPHAKRITPVDCRKCHNAEAYAKSIHAQSVPMEKPAGTPHIAAVCKDCHGAHTMEKASNPASSIYKQNIPRTCGKCHDAIAVAYGRGIHAESFKKGNLDAPACTDCHGNHQIFAPENPLSGVAPKNVSAEVCGACHSSVRLSERYNLPTGRFKTFEDSYHGLALLEGNVQVANCASCHGHHDIKPSSDPTSRTNKRNLAATCGQCHRGATEKFAIGPVHAIPASTGREALLYWIRWFYLILIASVVGAMFLYNSLDSVKKSRIHIAMRRGQIPRTAFGARYYLRMSLAERIQHGLLLSGFVVLVITGFMLKFPDAWWVVPFRDRIRRLFELRGTIHRIAGVVLIATSLFHIYKQTSWVIGRMSIGYRIQSAPLKD